MCLVFCCPRLAISQLPQTCHILSRSHHPLLSGIYQPFCGHLLVIFTVTFLLFINLSLSVANIAAFPRTPISHRGAVSLHLWIVVTAVPTQTILKNKAEVGTVPTRCYIQKSSFQKPPLAGLAGRWRGVVRIVQRPSTC